MRKTVLPSSEPPSSCPINSEIPVPVPPEAQDKVRTTSGRILEDAPFLKSPKSTSASLQKSSSNSEEEKTISKVFLKTYEHDEEGPLQQTSPLTADQSSLQTLCLIADLIKPEKLLALEEYLEIKNLHLHQKIHKLFEDQQERFKLLTSGLELSLSPEKNAISFAKIEKWMSDFSLIQLCSSLFELPNLQNQANALLTKIKTCGFCDITKDVAALRASLDGNVNHVKLLDIENSQMSEIPDMITQFKNLRVLCIPFNHIRMLPETLPDLNELRVNKNELKTLPNSLFKMPKLEILWLGGNQIECLPDNIAEATSLKEFDISCNHLTKLPPGLFKLPLLKSLNISGNRLKTITPEIFSLANLKTLWLHGNKIELLPDNIAKAQSLTDLNIADNQLTKLPPELFKLELKFLNIAGNPLENIPPEIFSMPQLQELCISKEQEKLLSPNTNKKIRIQIRHS